MSIRSITTRVRHFVPQTWDVSLVAEDLTEYSLGNVAVAESVPVAIPPEVPDGVYDVVVKTNGLAWRGLVQKVVGSVTIDRTSSSPIQSDLPKLTNFRYDIFKNWLRLLWEGDVPPDRSGLVSAGLWLGVGVPDFSRAPDVTLPLFSQFSTHSYIVRQSWDWSYGLFDAYWVPNYWMAGYWLENYWGLQARDTYYAGLAPISADGVVGAGQYIALPDRSVSIPPVAIEEG